MRFYLPKLPFDGDSVRGFLSPETLEYHYGKHHRKYIDKLNELTDSEGSQKSIYETILDPAESALRNNADQAWNHTFYWNGLGNLKPTEPRQSVRDAADKSFGSLDLMKKKFMDLGQSLFGSGWVWLVRDENGVLTVMTTENGGNPLRKQMEPLLTCDVWEHAYYLDYRNSRAKYLAKFFDHVNWSFVERNLLNEGYREIGSMMERDDKTQRGDTNV